MAITRSNGRDVPRFSLLSHAGGVVWCGVVCTHSFIHKSLTKHKGWSVTFAFHTQPVSDSPQMFPSDDLLIRISCGIHRQLNSPTTTPCYFFFLYLFVVGPWKCLAYSYLIPGIRQIPQLRPTNSLIIY